MMRRRLELAAWYVGAAYASGCAGLLLGIGEPAAAGAAVLGCAGMLCGALLAQGRVGR